MGKQKFEPANETEAAIADILGSAASAKRVAALVELIEQGGVEWDGESVEVAGARVQVEQVEVYGLYIGLDASGNAVSVASPHGFEIGD